MARLLLSNATVVATMDDALGEITHGSVLVEDGRILAVGKDLVPQEPVDERIDLSGHVLIPGLVNTHHHLFQCLTRAVPGAQDSDLFGWLTTLFPIWQRLTPDHVRTAATTGLAELLLSGCTTTSDHHYLYPNGVRLDDEIESAQTLGIRFVATRGAMSLGQSKGGLPPDSLVEQEDAILADFERVVATFHDPKPHALLQVALAPCSPFTVSREMMREAALMARRLGVRLHTHLAENDDDVRYSRHHYGRTPAEYARDLGWTGPDVWHAHCVKLDAPGIALFGASGTGVAHCPCSNMRLASGIAPIRAMLDHGVPVGLGVDGSASNDSSHLLAEARQAMLLQRVLGGAGALTTREALRLATVGGASVLGRSELGRLAPGMAADMAAFRLDGLGQAGGLHDPVAALVLTQPMTAAYTIVGGRVVVRQGQITGLDLPVHLERHNRLARSLLA